ncbi:SDR family NAD(P)-dependent oxidoreductase [Paratractidigestivibacter sp.]|uniref:SDR family NAD(P)-dependent oxidoreductase n=1 Tax=Paratractidigestivibacter sp. TaxID=2847316 RepID=UPI002ABE4D90|nr:SDR family NAD(P)-dependent oxidoreductase [Paratractidigestivibacter sp.]
MESFKEKYGEWALVVGASTGLGAAWAEECARRGSNVVICARRLEKLQEVSASLRERYGIQTKEFVVDISHEDAAQTIVDNIEGLDIGVCVYNAAIEHVGFFIKVAEERHKEQLVGNAQVPMELCWHLCRDMARKHRGLILLCSSMAGTVGCGNNAVYGGVKSFELILAKGLWYEMRKYGVDVAGVTVGAIATPEFARVQEEQAKAAAERGEKYKPAKATTPADAAAYVMERAGKGPHLFTSRGDATLDKLMHILPLKTAVTMMGGAMDKNFSQGYDLLDDEFTEIARQRGKGAR